MHKDLDRAFERLVDILKKDERCKGGWHYGSISRAQQDIYSDYDPVFLVSGKDFEAFAADVPQMFVKAADELLIFWGEDFNDENFKNYCTVIRVGENLHQLDFFIINQDAPDAWMCRQHCKGCTKDHIIFDCSGEVEAFLSQGYRTDNTIPDTMRAIDTFWFHTEMLIKYFKRNDIFKLIKNVDIIFQSHVDLLLSGYDTLDWGSWESKIKHCVPKEKQEHLLVYRTSPILAEIEIAVKKSMLLFEEDAKLICQQKGLMYPEHAATQIREYFYKRLACENWEV
ncbi:aminoglycoside 6-adenylyltransferase [Scatolibacter rhodanostii]|uniref:aminoglycoside 6-adenylyltransferase n=1 Tax=Scatolibacter rhodanostii TaxID=2014781 RepID=UPI000C082E8E|nr:aminoglycoside 6-adenylyltransferase [Scatolibacter rhodanostii]